MPANRSPGRLAPALRDQCPSGHPGHGSTTRLEPTTGLEPATSALARRCATAALRRHGAGTRSRTEDLRCTRAVLIPTELYRHAFRGLGSNQRALDPKSRRDAVNPPRSESRLPDSNRPPFPYRGIAQPAELRRHVDGALSGCCIVSRPCRRAPTRRHCVRGGIRTLTPLSGHQHLKLACLPFQHADLLSTYRHSSCHRKALHGPSSGYYVRAWRSVSQGSRTEDR